MSLRLNQKEEKKKNGGFYAAVALCCAAVCLAAWSTALSNRAGDDFTESDVITQPSGQTQRWMTEDEAGGEPASATTGSAVASAVGSTTRSTAGSTAKAADEAAATTSAAGETPPTQAPAPQPDAPAAAQSQKITPPIEKADGMGVVMKSFSSDELLYSVTMGDWRVHQGVDISAAEGAKVRAVSGGTVAEIMEDVLYGHTAVIKHADGSMLYYSGLTDKCPVSKGDQVASGDTIGVIGAVPCESADGPHLHLTLMKDGVFSDPAAAFGLK